MNAGHRERTRSSVGEAIAQRMRQVRGGDTFIVHMNKPESQTAEGLQPSLIELPRRGTVYVRLDQVELPAVP